MKTLSIEQVNQIAGGLTSLEKTLGCSLVGTIGGALIGSASFVPANPGMYGAIAALFGLGYGGVIGLAAGASVGVVWSVFSSD